MQQKIDKKFVLSDSSINCYGFRLLTTGYQLPEFQKNPIGYYMHDRDKGVALKWDDLQIEGDTITGKPVINLANERGQQIVDEVNNGFLNAASVGYIVALESELEVDPNDEEKFILTVTKWYNQECSLVDIPGNHSCLTQLFDKDNNQISLTDLKNLANNKMVPNLKKGVNLQSGNSSAQHEWVNEETNYLDLSKELRDVLFEHDRGLYGALFFCEYGKQPDGMDWPDISAAEERIKNIKATQLPTLRQMPFNELRKTGKLNRLKNLDILAYNKMMERDDDGSSDTDNNTALAFKNKVAPGAAKLTNTANFKELNEEQKKNLYSSDRSLFNALFFLEYGKFPKGTERMELNAAESRLAQIKKAELMSLMSLSYDDLRQQGKLKRLSNMSPGDYNRKLQED